MGQQWRKTFGMALAIAGTCALIASVAFIVSTTSGALTSTDHGMEGGMLVGLDGLDLTPYRNTTVGDVGTERFDPDAYLTEELESTTETLEDGTVLRVFEIEAVNKEIEIAPGVFFPACTYNGQVPGPTLRASEGERIRIHFTNVGDRPHSMHFHGFHSFEMDGAMLKQQVPPNGTFVYEFDADPVGVHLYHCHATPITQHIHNGLYGLWIVDPKGGRPPARELYMMMNGFDPNFDEENEIYSINTVAYHYQRHPIEVKQNELIRIYLANITEFDLVNSFHVHATFFDYYPTGTQPEPRFWPLRIPRQPDRYSMLPTVAYILCAQFWRPFMRPAAGEGPNFTFQQNRPGWLSGWPNSV
jgi:FtsP/CotA-like multicopper oxidase with cupredoxin domain